MILILHNIRSLHNVGSVFRSADVFGAEKIYLTGYTGVPPRREISKTALGSENVVPWESAVDVFSVLAELEHAGYELVGLETGPDAVPIGVLCCDHPIALVLGNEVEGIESELRARLKYLTAIPMPGHKRSLNVSVATGIALFVLGCKA
ncbi:TrmH family RNA methyltransferase [Candidatus Uhrbacteria bacterium]|nr:TrmH family RNA methyltransferase [Candidatus Uhrbacteria bacterium]